VALRSSFLSSEVSKLLLVIIKDVRIKKDVGRPQDDDAAPIPSQPISVKDLKVPPVLISLTQVSSKILMLILKVFFYHVLKFIFSFLNIALG